MDRVVAAGYTYNGSNFDFAVARLTTTGALDTSFDADGKQTIAIGNSHDFGYAVTIDSLNRVLVSGQSFNGSNYDFAVARLTASGALDVSFDGDGKNTIDFGPADDLAYDICVDSLNRVIAAGYHTVNSSNDDFAVTRLTAAGALDSTFDGDGKETISFGASEDRANGVAIDSMDQVVVAGYTFNGTSDDIAISRLTPTGALDSSFDDDGKQTITFGPFNDIAYGVVVDSFGRVVVGGYVGIATRNDLAVARLTNAGALDTTFDGDGKQTLELTAASTVFGRSIATDSMGRTVVAG